MILGESGMDLREPLLAVLAGELSLLIFLSLLPCVDMDRSNFHSLDFLSSGNVCSLSKQKNLIYHQLSSHSENNCQ